MHDPLEPIDRVFAIDRQAEHDVANATADKDENQLFAYLMHRLKVNGFMHAPVAAIVQYVERVMYRYLSREREGHESFVASTIEQVYREARAMLSMQHTKAPDSVMYWHGRMIAARDIADSAKITLPDRDSSGTFAYVLELSAAWEDAERMKSGLRPGQPEWYHAQGAMTTIVKLAETAHVLHQLPKSAAQFRGIEEQEES